jgi:hypothetical protein
VVGEESRPQAPRRRDPPMKKVLFLSGDTMCDALGGIGRSHRALFEAAGYDFIESNLSSESGLKALDAAIKGGGIEFAYSHAGIGAELVGKAQDGTEANLWNALGIPFISLFGDSPAYFFDRHVSPKGGFASLYFFQEHLKFRKSLPRAEGVYGLVPPIPFDATDKSTIDFRAKEKGRVLFLKKGNDPEKLIASWRNMLPTWVFEMMTELAGVVVERIDDDEIDIDALAVAYLADRHIDASQSTAMRLYFVAQLDDYLRRVKSTIIANALLDLPVEIHGYNWDHVDFRGRRAKFVAGGDYGRSRQEVLEALATVDMSPNTGSAPHERVLRAFGLYTLCLTNKQTFFDKHLSRATEFSYSFAGDSITSKVADIVARPKQAVELGIAVAEEFRQRFPVDRYVGTLVEVSGLLRLSGVTRPPGLQDFFVWPPAKL